MITFDPPTAGHIDDLPTSATPDATTCGSRSARWLMGANLARRAYYRIAQSKTIDNPDQRISEDVNTFVTSSISLSLLVISSLITAASFGTVPSNPHLDGRLILDPQRSLHYRYGAESECLYLIRPDGYVGYRSEPATKSAFHDYLERIFLCSPSH